MIFPTSLSEHRRAFKWVYMTCIIGFIYSLLICISLSPMSLTFAQTNTDDQEVFDDKRGDISIDQETLDQAETAFFEGLSAYRAKKYTESAKLFKVAHKLVPYRDLLFNIARSYEELGDKKGAVQYYREYLATKPIDETQVIHRMRELGVSQFEVSNTQKDAQSQSSPSLLSGSSSQIDYLSWGVIGSGVVLLGLGTYFGISALDQAEAARSATLQPNYNSAKQSAESDAITADISLSLGLIGVAGGIYLLLQSDHPHQIKNHVTQESTAPSTSSSSFSWRFLYERDLQGFGVSGQF